MAPCSWLGGARSGCSRVGCFSASPRATLGERARTRASCPFPPGTPLFCSPGQGPVSVTHVISWFLAMTEKNRLVLLVPQPPRGLCLRSPMHAAECLAWILGATKCNKDQGTGSVLPWVQGERLHKQNRGAHATREFASSFNQGLACIHCFELSLRAPAGPFPRNHHPVETRREPAILGRTLSWSGIIGEKHNERSSKPVVCGRPTSFPDVPYDQK